MLRSRGLSKTRGAGLNFPGERASTSTAAQSPANRVYLTACKAGGPVPDRMKNEPKATPPIGSTNRRVHCTTVRQWEGLVKTTARSEPTASVSIRQSVKVKTSNPIARKAARTKTAPATSEIENT